MRILGTIAAASALAACASTGAGDCASGAVGFASNANAPFTTACAIASARRLEARIDAGADARSYCTPAIGFMLGATGEPYPGVCVERMFADAFRFGEALYQKEAETAAAAMAAGDARREHWGLVHRLADIESRRRSPSLGGAERRALADEAATLEEQLAALDVVVANLEAIHERSRSELLTLRSEAAGRDEFWGQEPKPVLAASTNP